jgi:hypothetical protein
LCAEVCDVFERLLKAWLDRWHGAGGEGQFQFYRCEACRAVVTWRMIRAGACARCERTRVAPASLSAREKAGLLLWPWAYR